MATDVERLMIRLEASASRFEREMAKAQGSADRSTRAIERRMEQANDRIQRLMNSTASTISTGMARVGGLIGAYLSTDAIRKYADEWQSAVNKIAAAQGTRQNAGDRASQLTDIAIRSNSDLGATADLYSGLTRSTRDLNASQAQVLAVTETVNKAFAVGGQSASTQAGAIMQLNQALQSGKLSGDEFNSVAEGAPLIMQLVADKMGVARGELKKLASDGQITSKVFFEAMLEGGAAVEAQFATLVPTVSQSLNKLNAALTRYFGELATQYDLSGTVAAATQFVLDHLDTVVRAASVAGVAIAAAFSGGPIAAGVVAAGAALALFGDQIQPIAGDIATIGDYARVAFEYLMTAGPQAAEALRGALQPAIETIVGLLTGDMPAAASTFMTAVVSSIDAVINAFQFAGDTISTAWNAAAGAAAEAMINAMNTVIAAVNRAVAVIVSNINSVLAMAGQAALAAPKIAEFGNEFAGAGAKAGAAMAESFEKRFAQTTVKDALKGVNAQIGGATTAWRQAANARGDARAELARESARGKGLSRSDDGSLTQKLKTPKTSDEGGGGSGRGGKGRGGGAAKESEFQKEQENLTKRIETLNREREALSLSAFEAAKAEAAHKLLDAAKKDGVAVSDELRAKIDEQSAAYARAKVALDEAKAAQQAFKDLQQFIGHSLSGFFSDLVSGGENASKAMMNLAKKLADAALQAALLGEGPLAGLLGSKGSGGIVGMLFKGVTGGGLSLGGGGGLTGTGGLYDAGGYTGAGGKNDPAGIVHRGEYVMSQDAVRRLGVRNLEMLHRIGKRGYASGGFVGSAPAMPTFTRGGGGAASSPTVNISIPGAATDAQIRALVAQGVKVGMERTSKAIGRNAADIFRNADIRYAG